MNGMLTGYIQWEKRNRGRDRITVLGPNPLSRQSDDDHDGDDDSIRFPVSGLRQFFFITFISRIKHFQGILCVCKLFYVPSDSKTI